MKQETRCSSLDSFEFGNVRLHVKAPSSKADRTSDITSSGAVTPEITTQEVQGRTGFAADAVYMNVPFSVLGNHKAEGGVLRYRFQYMLV